MTDSSFWTKFVLAALATWRITHALSKEDGPADVIVRLRAALGTSVAGTLIDCFYCLSVWIAAPMALFVSRDPVELLFTWLALSGAACLLDSVTDEGKVMGDGMLRSEARSAPNHDDDDAEARRAAGAAALADGTPHPAAAERGPAAR